MTPEEIKQLRKRLGYTGLEMAQRIGIEDRSWRRWEEGTREMPELARRLLLMMERIPRVRFALEEIMASGTLSSFTEPPVSPGVD